MNQVPVSRGKFFHRPDWLKTVLRHPFANAGFALSAIIIGLLASLFHDKILAAFPFPLLDDEFHGWGDLVPEAVAFWSILGVFTLFLACREATRAEDNENIRRRYNEQLEELKMLQETRPPKDFLNQFDDLYRTTAMTVNRAIEAVKNSGKDDNDDDQDPLTLSTRAVLNAMLQLARRWDSTTDVKSIATRTYRANIMWCTPKAAVADSDRKAVLFELSKKLYAFDHAESLFEFADGFLKVDLLLSTKESTGDEADSEIHDLMLIYSRDRRTRTKNLLGAPMAVVTGKMSYVSDTGQMSTHAKEQRGFSKPELEKIDEYYQADSKGRSIISLPIPYELDGLAERHPVAVVNLYRDYAGIMGSEERAVQFSHLITPFLNELRRLIFAMDAE